MSRSAPRAGAAAALLLALLVLGASGAGAATGGTAQDEAGPSLQVTGTSGTSGTSGTELELGGTAEIELTGWPGGPVSVTLCGQGAQSGSLDCAVEASTLVTVGDDGTGTARLPVVDPASGCPCVVRGATLTGGVSAVLPVVVAGATLDVGAAGREPESELAPVPDAVAPPVPGLLTAAAVAEVGGTWQRALALVGGPVDYEVHVTVRNVGEVPLTTRQVPVLAGRNELGGNPVARLDIPGLDPGQEETYVVPVRLGGPVLGRHVLHASLDDSTASSRVVVEVESWPIVPPALAVLAGTWLLVRRSRPGLTAVLRAAAVTALVGAVVVGGHWAGGRWTAAQRAEVAQAELLAGFAPPLGGGSAQGERELLPSGSTSSPQDGDLVGVLRFPALGDDLQLAVVEGVSPEQLGRGPGRYPGTAMPGEVGNAVVAGHNARSSAGAPFDRLHDVEVGDTVRWETATGVWEYVVTGTRVVPPTAVSVLLPVRDDPDAVPTAAQLTLITCDYTQGPETHRLIVEAEIAPGPVEGRSG